MKKRTIWITVIAVLVVVIALSVGLGVGLTRNDDNRYALRLFCESLSNDLRRSSPEGINTTLAALAKKNNFPALGAGFFNGTYHDTAVGVRKIGASVNVTTDDVWHFASNTKAMTATVVGLLIQDGLFAWNSTLGNLLRDSDLDIINAYTDVTIQELSSHTSGISDRPLTNSRETLIASYDYNASEGRVFVSNFTLSAAPVATRGMFEYSNMNHVLLGLIIDAVTGKKAEDVIQSRLWSPLGMSTAGWGPNPESSTIDNPWPHVGNGPPGKGGLPTPLPDSTPVLLRDNPPCLYTAGGSHMSLADYARWLRVHLDPIVQAKLNVSNALIGKLQEVAPDSGANLYTYGGWIRVESGSGTGYSLQHDGSNTFNYATAIIEVPEGCAAVAVTNVAGQLGLDSNWVKGTHLVRDHLMSGALIF